ncbi:hypothetical protein BC332_25277 [Capsicum chinense]|nr:hypothetical protein BC332_25277 [Capsicum chinense]
MAPCHATSPVPSCPLFNEPAQLYCIVPRDDHGHHDHKSYYGDCDTDSLVKVRTRLGLDMEQKEARKEENLRIMMEDLIAPIKLESQMNTLDNSSTKLATGLKRTAPITGGCRIEGFVCVNKVPGNLVILACSIAHIFDASQMNMSHIISIFSFAIVVALDVTVLSMEGDIDVLGPSILNPKRLGVDDVKGTGEDLLYRLLWGEEGWNWWGGGA